MREPTLMELRQRFGAGARDFIRRAVFKTVVGPVRYRSERGYDAQRFWTDRFRRYGDALRGSGDEGLSEAQNLEVYEKAARTLVETAIRAGVDLPGANVLDVGCGPGFFTQVLHAHGVSSYTGVDITDALFGKLAQRFPAYRFVRRDVTAEPLEGEFDLVLMIDVAEHIVDEDRFDRCISNLSSAVVPGGVLLVGPMKARPGRHLFYVRFWSDDDVRRRLSTYRQLLSVPFRDGHLLAFRRPEAA